MNRVVSMTVETPGQLIDALRMSQNCALEKTNILVYNKDYRFAEPDHLVSNVRSSICAIFGNYGGSLANAQIYDKYHIKTVCDQHERYCKTCISASYLYSEPELNTIVCLASEIAEKLLKTVIRKNDTYAKIIAFSQWVKEYIRYNDLHDRKDCSAIELLKYGHGICQAIAAIAVPILSNMGIKTLYVLGEGMEKKGWTTHAWNVVELGGSWIHVDFTFALNSFLLPTTRTAYDEMMFRSCHRWDPVKYSEQQLSAKWASIRPSGNRTVLLTINENRCIVDGIAVYFERPVLILKDNKVQMEAYGLIRLLGGGVEYNADARQVILHINGKRIIADNGKSLTNNRVVDIQLLAGVGSAVWRDKSTLEVVI